MFVPWTIRVCRYGLLVVAVLGWCQVSEAQNAPRGAEPAARPVPAQRGEDYVLRTYAVGDLVINIEDHPYSDSLPGGGGGGMGGGGWGGGGGGQFSVPDDAGKLGRILGRPSIHPVTGADVVGGGTNRFQLAQLGGGLGGGGVSEMGTGNAGPSASITVADLLRVLTNTVAADTWAVNGGAGEVEPLGTTLVVWQVPRVHERIGELLDKLREGSAERNTVTIDARWLMLNSDELDSLVLPDQKGVPQVDPKRLAELTRRPGSIRGITNCLSSQLVYVVSGTTRNIVSGFIPVVGSLELPDRDLQLANGETEPRIQFVSHAPAAGNNRAVGYQPIVERPNFGALLEIRPTLVPSAKPDVGAVVDLKSTVTVAGDTRSPGGISAPTDEIAPAVDRVAIETQQFATTLRMPLGKPILVGGLTYVPFSAGLAVGSALDREGDEGAVAEVPQLYLVLEVR